MNMATVFDVIEILMGEKKLSVRRLAQMAKLPPTTLESALTRRSRWISVHKLKAIAAVFNLEWTDLFEPDREESITDPRNPKVSSLIRDEDMDAILSAALEKSGEGFSFFNPKREQPVPAQQTDEMAFLQTTTAILNRLNNDGLMEAMRRLLDIAADPRFCKDITPGN